MDYPVSDKLRSALLQLFDDESVALGLLGQGIPLAQRDVSCSTATNPAQRIRLLCDKLESFISQMASEVGELGADELPRLRSEAAAMLLVLREIQSHFPDVIT